MCMVYVHSMNFFQSFVFPYFITKTDNYTSESDNTV